MSISTNVHRPINNYSSTLLTICINILMNELRINLTQLIGLIFNLVGAKLCHMLLGDMEHIRTLLWNLIIANYHVPIILWLVSNFKP